MFTDLGDVAAKGLAAGSGQVMGAELAAKVGSKCNNMEQATVHMDMCAPLNFFT